MPGGVELHRRDQIRMTSIIIMFTIKHISLRVGGLTIISCMCLCRDMVHGNQGIYSSVILTQ